MKKRIRQLIFCICISLLAAGCGNQGNSGSSSSGSSESGNSTGSSSSGSAVSYDVMEYVTLGQYKGLEVSRNGYGSEVTDAEVEAEISRILENGATYKDTDKKRVENGDVANIDFVGKINGEAFQGGSGEDYDLIIGSNSMIDGFESGLVGVGVSETVDLNLKFPDNYFNEEYQGKEAVFTVTVNRIKQRVVPELTEEFVKANSESQTVEEYRAQLKAQLQAEREQELQDYKMYTAANLAVENATVKSLPEGLLEQAMEQQREMARKEAQDAQMEFAEYMEKYYGMTEDSFNSLLESVTESNLREKLVFEAIAKDAGQELTEEEYGQKLDTYAKDDGYADGGAVEEQFGRQNLWDYFQMIKVMEYLRDSAVLKD